MERSVWQKILFSTLFALLFMRIIVGAVRTDLVGFKVLAVHLVLPYVVFFLACVLYGRKPKLNKLLGFFIASTMAMITFDNLTLYNQGGSSMFGSTLGWTITAEYFIGILILVGGLMISWIVELFKCRTTVSVPMVRKESVSPMTIGASIIFFLFFLLQGFAWIVLVSN